MSVQSRVGSDKCKKWSENVRCLTVISSSEQRLGHYDQSQPHSRCVHADLPIRYIQCTPSLLLRWYQTELRPILTFRHLSLLCPGHEVIREEIVNGKLSGRVADGPVLHEDQLTHLEALLSFKQVQYLHVAQDDDGCHCRMLIYVQTHRQQTRLQVKRQNTGINTGFFFREGGGISKTFSSQ